MGNPQIIPFCGIFHEINQLFLGYPRDCGNPHKAKQLCASGCYFALSRFRCISCCLFLWCPGEDGVAGRPRGLKSLNKWGFPYMGVSQNGWFIMENSMKMDDDWGYPYFRKPPNGNVTKQNFNLTTISI